MTAPPRRCRCGHPGEKASRALPSGRPSGLPPCNAPPSAPTPRPGTPTGNSLRSNSRREQESLNKKIVEAELADGVAPASGSIGPYDTLRQPADGQNKNCPVGLFGNFATCFRATYATAEWSNWYGFGLGDALHDKSSFHVLVTKADLRAPCAAGQRPNNYSASRTTPLVGYPPGPRAGSRHPIPSPVTTRIAQRSEVVLRLASACGVTARRRQRVTVDTSQANKTTKGTAHAQRATARIAINDQAVVPGCQITERCRALHLAHKGAPVLPAQRVVPRPCARPADGGDGSSLDGRGGNDTGTGAVAGAGGQGTYFNPDFVNNNNPRESAWLSKSFEYWNALNSISFGSRFL